MLVQASSRQPRAIKLGAVTDEAEAIAIAGVQVPQHPRIKGWDPSDVERLLPVEMKVTDGKVSNFLINQVFLMIEQHSQAANKKIKTVNSDVYNNMAKLSMEVFSKSTYGETYGDILTANIILCPILHGDHWCLLIVQLKDENGVFGFIVQWQWGTNFIFQIQKLSPVHGYVPSALYRLIRVGVLQYSIFRNSTANHFC